MVSFQREGVDTRPDPDISTRRDRLSTLQGWDDMQKRDQALWRLRKSARRRSKRPTTGEAPQVVTQAKR